MNHGHRKLLVFQNYILRALKKNKFETSVKIKTKCRTIKNVVRHQLTNIDDTIKDIFFTKRTKEEW